MAPSGICKSSRGTTGIVMELGNEPPIKIQFVPPAWYGMMHRTRAPIPASIQSHLLARFRRAVDDLSGHFQWPASMTMRLFFTHEDRPEMLRTRNEGESCWSCSLPCCQDRHADAGEIGKQSPVTVIVLVIPWVTAEATDRIFDLSIGKLDGQH